MNVAFQSIRRAAIIGAGNLFQVELPWKRVAISPRHGTTLMAYLLGSLGAEYMSDMTYCQDAPYNISLHTPPDVSVTRLAEATRAPDAGASELKR